MIRIISGKYKGKALDVPKKGARPTLGALRESLFNILQHEIEEATFLDLFAGGGSVGCEALSRGAKNVCFVEHDRRSCEVIKKNCASLGVEKAVTIYCSDVFKALPKMKTHDIVFADPPYEQRIGDKLLEYFDNDHRIIGKTLFIEESYLSYAPINLEVISRRKVGRSTLLELCCKSSST